MSGSRYRNKSEEAAIALERIRILFELAGRSFKKSPPHAQRYVTLARTIAMKYRLSMPSQFKPYFCKKCSAYLVPGVNCRVRLAQKRIIRYCMACKKYRRTPYKK